MKHKMNVGDTQSESIKSDHSASQSTIEWLAKVCRARRRRKVERFISLPHSPHADIAKMPKNTHQTI